MGKRQSVGHLMGRPTGHPMDNPMGCVGVQRDARWDETPPIGMGFIVSWDIP